MSSKNTIIVASIIFGAFVIMIVAIYIGENGLGGGNFDKGQRFTAKPGTTRENAILLTSNKRPTTADPEDTIARRAENQEDDDPLEVKSLSTPEPDPRRGGPAGKTAREALNSLSPEAGLRKLEDALALPNTPEQKALLLEAQGQLYAELDPPDYEKSLASFDEAAELATDPVIQEAIVFETAQMLLQAGEEAAALRRIDAHLATGPPRSDMGYKLRLMQGQMHERAGALEEAEATYQAVLSEAGELPDYLDKETAVSLMRLAGLRLTSLYRDNDRSQAADSLARDLKRQLKAMASR